MIQSMNVAATYDARSNCMEEYIWETAEEINEKLAQRIKGIRKRKLISQEQLSRLSGVSFGSIKRFENTGKISLLSLTKLAIALNCADEIRELFTNVPYQSIEEVIHERNESTSGLV